MGAVLSTAAEGRVLPRTAVHLWFPSCVSADDAGHTARGGHGHLQCASPPWAFLSFQRPEDRRVGEGWETTTAFTEPVRSRRAETRVCVGGCVPHTCVLHRAAYLRGSTFQNAGAPSKSSCARILHLSCFPLKTLWPRTPAGEGASS